MSEFFKNNPIALSHCILYKFIQGKMSDEALAKLSRQKGNGSEVSDFRSYRFKQEYFDEKESIEDVRKILRKDKYALRACILSEALECRQLKNIDNNKRFSSSCYDPSSAVYENFRERIRDNVMEYTDFDAWFFEYADYNIGHEEVYMKYRKFCKVIVDDIMKFTEFEYWFYRFFHGDFDLNFERNLDKKVHELEDMPIDVMRNIVQHLNIFDRVALAKTSRPLQTFIKSQKLFHHTLKLIVDVNEVCINLGEQNCIRYTKGKENDCMKQVTVNKKFFRGPFQCDDRRIWNLSIEKKAISDFKSILKYPKLLLETLQIEFKSFFNTPFPTIFKSKVPPDFNSLLHVKKISLPSSWRLIEFLPLLKPGYLTTIDLCFSADMKEIVKMEQWKQAKYFTVKYFSFDDPLHHLYHFKTFSVYLEKLTVEDIRQMKKILFRSPDFERCEVGVRTPVDDIGGEFGDPIPGSPDVYHYPLPNPSEYFEIKMGNWRIEITRKNK